MKFIQELEKNGIHNILHGIGGFCFLVISQTFIQTNIIVDVNSSWKSLSMFHLIQEKQVLYYILYNKESSLQSMIVSIAGSSNYAIPDKFSGVLLLPWIIYCSIHWISTSYLSIHGLLISYGSNAFWRTALLLILTIIAKGLLLSEVVMKTLESVLKLAIFRKDIKFLDLNEKTVN